MNYPHFDSEQDLSAALKAVAESTANEAPSMEVREAVLRAYRDRRLRGPQAARAQRWIAWVAAAAVVAIILPAMVFRWNAQWRPEAVAPVETATASDVHTPPVPAEEPIVMATRKLAVPRKEEPVAVAVTDFLELGYTGPETDSYQVVRVRMNRAALAQYGLPVNFERAEEPVDADLLLGNDGIPRAVRFVSNTVPVSYRP